MLVILGYGYGYGPWRPNDIRQSNQRQVREPTFQLNRVCNESRATRLPADGSQTSHVFFPLFQRQELYMVMNRLGIYIYPTRRCWHVGYSLISIGTPSRGNAVWGLLGIYLWMLLAEAYLELMVFKYLSHPAEYFFKYIFL